MRIALFLTVVLFIWAQVTAQRVQFNDESNDGENDLELLDLTNIYGDNTNLRNLNDLKNKIKKSILAAWEIFKAVSKNTNVKITAWVEKVKEKIDKSHKLFTESLDKLKNEFNNLINKITVTGDNLKTCLKEHKNSIENKLKEIVSNVKNCISNNVKNISNIETSQALLSIDDTIFLATVQNKLSATCDENNKKCLNDVQNGLIKEIETATQNLSQKYLQARDAIDDRLENTIICITEGLTISAKSIVNEIIQVIQCVKNKGH